MKKINIPIIIAVGLILASCSSSVRFSQGDSPSQKRKDLSSSKPPKEVKSLEVPNNIPEKGLRAGIVDEARKWIGAPYLYGGESHDGVDCSGFVMEVYNAFGMKIPRTATEQYNQATLVRKDECRAGDLIFFGAKGKISHVGIYVGENKMIHASSTKGVMVSSIEEDYFAQRYAGMGSVLE